MRFHSLRIQLKGIAVNSFDSGVQELDIADKFSQLARSLGLEGSLDAYAGLWTTQPVYNERSLLKGDFLAEGLHLDLLCDSNYDIPFSSIFLCLGETLRRIATCRLTEVTVLCDPHSVSMPVRRANCRGDMWHFLNMSVNENPLPIAQYSALRLILRDKQNFIISNKEVPLMTQHCYLPELALPFSGIWSRWKESLHHVGTIQITVS